MCTNIISMFRLLPQDVGNLIGYYLYLDNIKDLHLEMIAELSQFSPFLKITKKLSESVLKCYEHDYIDIRSGLAVTDVKNYTSIRVWYCNNDKFFKTPAWWLIHMN